MNILQTIYEEMSRKLENTKEQTFQLGHVTSGTSFFDLLAPEMEVPREDDPVHTTFLQPLRIHPAQLFDAEHETWVPTCLVRSALESDQGVAAMVTLPEREPVGIEVVHRSRVVVNFGERTSPARELLRWSQHFAIGIHDIIESLPFPATAAAVADAALASPGLWTTVERIQHERDGYVSSYTASLGLLHAPGKHGGYPVIQFAGHGIR